VPVLKTLLLLIITDWEKEGRKEKTTRKLVP